MHQIPRIFREVCRAVRPERGEHRTRFRRVRGDKRFHQGVFDGFDLRNDALQVFERRFVGHEPVTRHRRELQVQSRHQVFDRVYFPEPVPARFPRVFVDIIAGEVIRQNRVPFVCVIVELRFLEHPVVNGIARLVQHVRDEPEKNRVKLSLVDHRVFEFSNVKRSCSVRKHAARHDGVLLVQQRRDLHGV